MTTFCSANASGLSNVLASPLMCLATCLALAACSNTCCLKLSFLLNQTLSQQRAGWSPSFRAVRIGWIVRLLLTMQGGVCCLVFLVRWIISSFSRAKAILFQLPQAMMLLTSLAKSQMLLSSKLVAQKRQISLAYLKRRVGSQLSSSIRQSMQSTSESGKPYRVLQATLQQGVVESSNLTLTCWFVRKLQMSCKSRSSQPCFVMRQRSRFFRRVLKVPCTSIVTIVTLQPIARADSALQVKQATRYMTKCVRRAPLC